MLDLDDFELQDQPEDNLMVTISWVSYNGSYYMSTEIYLTAVTNNTRPFAFKRVR